jgi:hypothetical protein
MNVWLCAWPDGKSAHDSEVADELAAREVVASGKAREVVVYQIWIEGEVA